MTDTVLLIDDEAAIRESLGQALELAGFEVRTLPDARALAQTLDAGFDGVVLTDLRLPGADGLAVLESVRAHDRGLPVVLMTGHGDVRTAVRAMRAGAFDFIEKPFRPETAIHVLRHALRIRAGRPAGPQARDADRSGQAAPDVADDAGLLAGRILGRSPVMVHLRERILRYAALNADVLIRGETGTGKELVARALHDHGSRSGANFVAINCAALPADLIASELFGHEAGAFTGARTRRIGKFEFAHGGTIFLDEIESMPASLQAELLRILQERRLTRLGGNDELAVDIRVIAAAKVDLLDWVRDGRFREDLYYRLDVLTIDLPPLRERAGDATLLFEHFVRQAAGSHGLPEPGIGESVRAAVAERGWPGNVRELQNAALRFVLDQGLSGEPAPIDPVTVEGIPGNPGRTLADRVAEFEAGLIQEALDRHGGELGATESELSISRRTLHEKIRRYGLTRRR
ncbi:MAG: sigma-54 dependent transcriptional regulator [Burkholderiaceae bacterium]